MSSSVGSGDNTVVAPRHGTTINTLVKKPGNETPEGQDVVKMIIESGGDNVPTNVDAIGIGKSAVDVAKATGLRTVRPIIVSESTEWTDPKIRNICFVNVRSAAMWNVRNLLDPEGGPPETRLALPPDPKLLADLTAPTYELTISGIRVEKKDDIRKRLGRSTDDGDAVMLACWIPPEPPRLFSEDDIRAASRGNVQPLFPRR
jgi:hypothetical protein